MYSLYDCVKSDNGFYFAAHDPMPMLKWTDYKWKKGLSTFMIK